MNVTGGWERVRAIFQAALEQAPERRGAFLSTACDGDDALRGEVSSLLAAHDGAGGFLETPAVDFDPHGRRDSILTLRPGDRVGEFTVVAPLGAGGMGEVYRARDSRLGREVALKLLPPAFADDPQRLARFERESRVLASLNHPNIASIHSIEHLDDLHLLVLELVEGPTLADRLERGAIPMAEVVAIARQLADALEAAHAQGIVHRDLKPANVKLTASGHVMLLDFGLAKERVAGASEALGPESAAHSSAGLILGTCAYMSPEQARGQSVDQRTDIWAFGCILFESLSGQKAFRGDTPSDTIAAVLERQPDWQVLPHPVPASLDRVLRRCLEKDPNRRLHHIADARLEIDDALHEGPEPRRERPPRSRLGAAVAGATLVLLCGAGAGWWVRDALSSGAPVATATRFAWPLPADLRLESAPAVSPDGQHIAFTASVHPAPSQLYVRPLRALDIRPIPRTDGATQPFWSPDSRTLGYFAGRKLMKVTIDGGAPVEICAARDPRGGTWSRDGVIVFSSGGIYSGLSRVSADGGAPEAVTLLDVGQGENSHRWPAFLPDGVHFLYFVRSVVAERRGVYQGRIDRAASRPGAPLYRSEAEAVFAPLDAGGRGVLLSVARGHLDARPFDARRLELTGDPITIPLLVGGNTPHHASMVSVSADVLTYASAPLPYGQRLASSTRTGELRQSDADRAIVNWPRVSPDGLRVVSQRVDAVSGSPDLWVEDLDRGTRHKVTQGTSGQLAVWSPDGSRLAYLAGTFSEPVLTIGAADGTGVLSTVSCPRLRCEPSDWSRDGRWLLVTAMDGQSVDVWMLPAAGGDPPRPLLTGSFVERDARFSRDGDVVAYVTEETGRPEIAVESIGAPRRRQVVSTGGGTQPVWTRDGAELWFVDPQGFLRKVEVRRTAGGLSIAGAASRVDVQAIGTGHYGTQYDLSPDGRRVYFLDQQLAESPGEIGVVVAWREWLK